MKVNLNNDNAGDRLDHIRMSLGLSKKELAEKFNVSLSAISVISTQNRMLSTDLIIKLLDIGASPLYIYYGLGEPFNNNYNKFLENYNPNGLNKFLPKYLEDYILINLKRNYKLERTFLNKFFPTSEFITRHIETFDPEILKTLSIENAKFMLIDHLKQVKLHKILDSYEKRKRAIEEIEYRYADIEVYVLLKNKQLFVKK
jgi:transcriptional regulator with XRE-family HTH domain